MSDLFLSFAIFQNESTLTVDAKSTDFQLLSALLKQIKELVEN